MRKVILALLAIAAVVSGPTVPTYAATSDAVVVAPSQIVEGTRRETCWRTNRSTGQKFRIC